MNYVASVLFLFSAAAFIVGLRMLRAPATARKGNLVSAAGMAAAMLGTLLMTIHAGDFNSKAALVVLGGIAAGTAIGIPAARLVKMTAMPEMVALFNGFGGIASLLIGWSQTQEAVAHGATLAEVEADLVRLTGGQANVVTFATFLAVLIGGVTFTGSVVAWGKLSERMTSKPVLYPGQNVVNGLTVLLSLALGIWFTIQPDQIWLLYILIPLSFILGVAVVIPIGGGDMPVVISLLNSYSGLAACAAGLAINNALLIIIGALVGASGLILTRIMCVAMNRSLGNVLFSGFGAVSTSGGAAASGEKKEARILSPQDAYFVLEAAQSVIFVPGYGMAVAQAQHAVKQLADLLVKNGCDVKHVIHPVAGRMPGHMNVLLAEANVEYDQLAVPEDVNATMESVDVAIVIGANDVVNPAALTDKSSPIYGMPIIEVHRARAVFTLKRSLASGYAGIDNPLFYLPNNSMVLGDAKKTIEALISEFKSED
ncbi:MAG: NAD(P)(+) transhydrogenase (Re/Si-specific) subunit beta [Leptolyngbya sp. PLA3]|nr:MAG: NAD(P)(+) transhydrogenase (Re/Si-specific) subunit beta [Cyanobacteria bacterium CYA]MCE7969822.1 NAD(P)(+) transhydrogenase (Re/Si-specific) subunit beta [Leptolyngbya sp. PL-A3]